MVFRARTTRLASGLDLHACSRLDNASWLEHSLPLDFHHADATQRIRRGRFVPADGGNVHADLPGGIQQRGIGFDGYLLTINIQSDFP